MNKIKGRLLLVTAMTLTGLTVGCAKEAAVQNPSILEGNENITAVEVLKPDEETAITVDPSTEITELEEGFSAVRYEGNDWFDMFLNQGGASQDSDVIEFLTRQMQTGKISPVFQTSGFGCSTLAVQNQEKEVLFGRNFDWENCEALVVQSNPSKAYASISTVNMDFIRSGYGEGLEQLPDEIRTMIALYAPLDGMNENGLAVSVNMIQDSDIINQDTGKPDLTTTTAIRLLLNEAGDVEEALTLLGQYDMHSSMGMMVHFALADQTGRSVVVEYINHEMIVTDTPVVTNFYLAEGEKQGIGTSQSHERYEILMEEISEHEVMSVEQVRDALDRVSKKNFGEFESTEWSIVFHLDAKEARYYHRENYNNSYVFSLNQ